MVIGINYIKKGADAVLSREMNNTEFQSAFAAVLNGRKYVFEGMGDLILKDFCDKDRINKLSTRESQIVQLLIKGKRTVDICGELNPAASTVSTIKSKIYKKMNIGNIIDLQARFPLLTIGALRDNSILAQDGLRGGNTSPNHPTIYQPVRSDQEWRIRTR
jgi:DNA-binding NarL/FixJ family response regulator